MRIQKYKTIVANDKLDTIRPKKYGQVLEYINQFKTTCQNSDYIESGYDLHVS